MADSIREKAGEDNVEDVSEFQEIVERYEGKPTKKVVRKVGRVRAEEMHPH